MTVTSVVVGCLIYLFGLLAGYHWGRDDGKRAEKTRVRLFGEDLDD